MPISEDSVLDVEGTSVQLHAMVTTGDKKTDVQVARQVLKKVKQGVHVAQVGVVVCVSVQDTDGVSAEDVLKFLVGPHGGKGGGTQTFAQGVCEVRL